MKKILPIFLSLTTLFMASSCVFWPYPRIKNVILFIGDGMSENHILNAIDYFNLNTPAFLTDQKGYINTNSLSGTTDSAAGATAFSTGQKVFNNNVAQLDGNNLERVTDIAKAAGMKTGILTTDVLYGATPAAFSAHSQYRTSTKQIIETQALCDVNLLLGQYSYFHQYYATLFTAENYTYVESKEDLFTQKDTTKLLGNINDVGSEYINGNETDFQLKDMVQFAIEYLNNPNGFFLMIESAYIDKYSHTNNFHEAMCEVRSLFDTIEYLYQYAADGKTAIFITADHETGALQRIRPNQTDTTALYNSFDHTSTPVPLFIKNYTLNLEDFGYLPNATPENTIIFEACQSIINNKH